LKGGELGLLLSLLLSLLLLLLLLTYLAQHHQLHWVDAARCKHWILSEKAHQVLGLLDLLCLLGLRLSLLLCLSLLLSLSLGLMRLCLILLEHVLELNAFVIRPHAHQSQHVLSIRQRLLLLLLVLLSRLPERHPLPLRLLSDHLSDWVLHVHERLHSLRLRKLLGVVWLLS